METDGVRIITARGNLRIAWIDDDSYWEWTEKEGSRSEQVAFLKSVCWLDVNGEFTTELHPGQYTLSWMLRFEDPMWNDRPVTLTATDGSVSKTENLPFPLNRETASRVMPHGWLEYDALEFRVPASEEEDDPRPVKLNFALTETASGMWKSGMYVDGLIIRPSSMAESIVSEPINLEELEFVGSAGQEFEASSTAESLDSESTNGEELVAS